MKMKAIDNEVESRGYYADGEKRDSPLILVDPTTGRIICDSGTDNTTPEDSAAIISRLEKQIRTLEDDRSELMDKAVKRKSALIAIKDIVIKTA